MNCISYLDYYTELSCRRETLEFLIYIQVLCGLVSFIFIVKYIFSVFFLLSSLFFFYFILFHSLYDRLVGFISFPLRFITCYANTLASSKARLYPTCTSLRFLLAAVRVYMYCIKKKPWYNQYTLLRHTYTRVSHNTNTFMCNMYIIL